MKTRLTLKPGQDGTKQELEKYGGALVCIRFRYDVKSGKRLKTVELIVEATDWKPPHSQYASEDIVSLRISASDIMTTKTITNMKTMMTAPIIWTKTGILPAR